MEAGISCIDCACYRPNAVFGEYTGPNHSIRRIVRRLSLFLLTDLAGTADIRAMKGVNVSSDITDNNETFLLQDNI